MTRLERLGSEAYKRIRAVETESKRRAKERSPNKRKLYARELYRRKRNVINRQQRMRRGLPEATRPCPEHCEACKRTPSKRISGAGVSFYVLHLDHDHATGEFRGWLCAKCNTGLGLLGDSIEQLEMRLAYLKRAKGG